MARIGKNVLESLTRSMYADSKCVYREYIQNSADQIDEAKRMHPEFDYNVYVTIESQKRTIIIEDNATGVKTSEIKDLLVDVARSTKERGVNKGFRGIGRLGGLAYCKTLIFETSYFEENVFSKVTWNAVQLNNILDDETDDRDASEVIDAITTINSEKDNSIRDKHFFRVIMQDVTDDKLLNEKEIRDYLSMVSPVDYSNHFLYRTKIYEFMYEHNLHLDCYNIFVGDCQIFKNYSMTIYGPDNKEDDKVTGIEFWYENNSKGEPMYWGWYSISGLKGIMPKTNIARNIRLRCENIQLGDETACFQFMTSGDKARFVRYFFGEIHVLPTSKLIPNSQRDYLREDVALKEFEHSVESNFLKLEKLCYGASEARKNDKTIQKSTEKAENIVQKMKKGFTSQEEQKKAQDDLKKALEEKDKAINSLSKLKKNWEESNSPLVQLFSPIGIQEPEKIIVEEPVESSEPINTPQLRTDNPKYDKFQEEEIQLILTVYKVIEKTLNNEKEREALIDKIEAEITK